MVMVSKKKTEGNPLAVSDDLGVVVGPEGMELCTESVEVWRGYRMGRNVALIVFQFKKFMSTLSNIFLRILSVVFTDMIDIIFLAG